MAKNKINQMLQQKDPAVLRTPIKPVKILTTETDSQLQEIDRTEKDNKQVDEKERSIEENKKTVRSKRTEKGSQKAERKHRSIYTEQDVQTLLEVKERAKKRYSFEIYTDQIGDIQQICELYEETTGKKLSASRLIREVLDSFIPDALKAFEKAGE